MLYGIIMSQYVKRITSFFYSSNLTNSYIDVQDIDIKISLEWVYRKGVYYDLNVLNDLEKMNCINRFQQITM